MQSRRVVRASGTRASKCNGVADRRRERANEPWTISAVYLRRTRLMSNSLTGLSVPQAARFRRPPRVSRVALFFVGLGASRSGRRFGSVGLPDVEDRELPPAI